MSQSWNRVLLCAVVACSTAGAQTAPMSPTLLRRLAEAVESDQSGRPVFVVARAEIPNNVAGMFANRDSAKALARRSGPTYDVFGPYVAPIPAPGPVAGVAVRPPAGMALCVHDGLSNMYPPVEGAWMTPPPAAKSWSTSRAPRMCIDTLRPPGKINKVSLVFEYDHGGKWGIPIQPGVDAVFMSKSAIEKFAVPYYVRVLGIDAAAAMRHEVLGTDRP